MTNIAGYFKCLKIVKENFYLLLNKFFEYEYVGWWVGIWVLSGKIKCGVFVSACVMANTSFDFAEALAFSFFVFPFFPQVCHFTMTANGELNVVAAFVNKIIKLQVAKTNKK